MQRKLGMIMVLVLSMQFSASAAEDESAASSLKNIPEGVADEYWTEERIESAEPHAKPILTEHERRKLEGADDTGSPPPAADFVMPSGEGEDTK